MPPVRTYLLITAVYSSLLAGSESALVRKPSNATVVKGSAVTLHCSSDVSGEHRWTTTITWYKVLGKSFPCAEYWHWKVAQCLGDDAQLLHSSFSAADPLPARFNVTVGDNSTHVTRDLRISAVQLTDAGYYICAEQRIDDFGGIQYPSVAQLLVVCGDGGESVEVTTESPVENEPVENEPSQQPSEIFKYATFALAAVAFISLLLNIVLIICLRRKTSTKGKLVFAEDKSRAMEYGSEPINHYSSADVTSLSASDVYVIQPSYLDDN